jgi:hypothetical protein
MLVFLFLSSHARASQTASYTTSINFGNVQVGSSMILPCVVTNTTSSSITISQASASGPGFTFVGPNLPITLAPQQTVNLSVSFTPQNAGSVSGGLTASYWSTWGHSKVHYYTASSILSGSGQSTTNPGYLTAPSSMNLGSVPVGSSQTKPVTVSNTGAATLTISGATVSGTGYAVSGLNFPYDLAPGASVNLSVIFSPTIAGTSNATLSLASNASDPSVGVSLTGSGTSSSGTLGVTPGSMSFGSVTVGSAQTQNGTVTASGGSVVLSSTSSSNSAFTLGGLTLPLTLGAGQSVPFTVTFAPTTAGTASANIAFFSSNSSSAAETASGSGATIQHIVNLSWNASTSASVAGYNIYRGTSAAGPFSKVNSIVNPSMSYSDGSVQSGKTYYYATTAIDSTGTESSYSNQVTAAVPYP